MIPEDRELLQALRQQQADLKQAMARIDLQLAALESRNGITAPQPAGLRPPPPPAIALLPKIPSDHPVAALPAIPRLLTPPPPPPVAELPPIPPTPPVPPAPKPSLEFQFGRWLTVIGAIFGVITLALIFSLTHALIFRLLGPGGILGMSALLCVGIVILGDRLERRSVKLLYFARSIMAMGLAGLYLTFYAAYSFPSVRIIHNPYPAGLLLLFWSAYVLWIADRKNSQGLALFSIVLAYVSTAINPIGRFSMAADLLLAATAVFFLLRRGWAALSYFSLIATYFALLRRLVIDENGQLVLDTSRTLPFAPYAVYLISAWAVFTAAVLISTGVPFRGGKRLAFLTLNNGAIATLLPLTAWIAGYGFHAVGWTLLWTGVGFVVASIFAGGRRPEAALAEVSAAYLAQGIAVVTGGLMSVYAGITRGIILGIETLFLGMAASFSRSTILKICAYVSAFFATMFLIWEIAVNARQPWLLGIGGAGVMLLNARWSRRDARHDPLARDRIVLSASYYCALGLGLIGTAMASELSDAMLPPALAVVAAVLTFSIYFIKLYELPPLAQTLLLAAQALVLFPAETGETLPRWTTSWVAGVTLLLLAWWSRQKVTRYGAWLIALNFVYALAVVGLAYHAVRPYANDQNWMIASALLSAGFLVFGAFARVWGLAFMGQLFLAMSLYHFFIPHGDFSSFPWTWWAAAVPMAVVFATGRSVHAWLRIFPEIGATLRETLRVGAFAYLLVALAMLIRWVCALVPAPDQLATFLFLGTLVLAWNTSRGSAFGIRCSFVLSLLGIALTVHTFDANARALTTFINGFAIFSLLSQPTLLRHAAAKVVSSFESWCLILLSAASGWLFVGAWVAERMNPRYLTMGWALYALFLFFFGLLVWERRQRWCGLAILVAAMARVIFYDIWGFSNGYKVLTFVVLTLISLGLGFLYARLSDRLKVWL